MEIRKYSPYNEKEILSLYASVGWTAYTGQPDTLRQGFAHSLLTLGAYEGDTLLGLVRAVGDGHTVVFIQDLLVSPQHQHKGVGSALLRAVLDRYAHVRQIQLTTDNTHESISFYQKQGFKALNQLDCCGLMKD